MRIKQIPRWVWWVAATLAAVHIYFFQELIAAELIFGIAFGAFLVLLLAVYLVSEAGDRGLEWLETKSRVAVAPVRRAESISKRTFGHQDSSENLRLS